ncbi:hypothetical protein PHYPSEUDO_007977 [Phytophthora pseudosyringae]|uniref:Uncharacterized protein n=1 Tax=Phytophthora pseudosyringae TaxID=221518 RepID=A0A8T1WDT2_9STRA|nr:hypothetical protein PHYPSEUDO_007977 [Phytophthora pseudosyringae]
MVSESSAVQAQGPRRLRLKQAAAARRLPARCAEVRTLRPLDGDTYIYAEEDDAADCSESGGSGATDPNADPRGEMPSQARGAARTASRKGRLLHGDLAGRVWQVEVARIVETAHPPSCNDGLAVSTCTCTAMPDRAGPSLSRRVDFAPSHIAQAPTTTARCCVQGFRQIGRWAAEVGRQALTCGARFAGLRKRNGGMKVSGAIPFGLALHCRGRGLPRCSRVRSRIRAMCKHRAQGRRNLAFAGPARHHPFVSSKSTGARLQFATAGTAS